MLSTNLSRHTKSCDGTRQRRARSDVLGLECSRCHRTYQTKSALYSHRYRVKDCTPVASTAVVRKREPQEEGLRAWQKELLWTVAHLSEREIIVVVDEKGGAGKTFMAKKFVESMNVLLLRTGGNSKGFSLPSVLYHQNAHASTYEAIVFDIPKSGKPSLSQEMSTLIECARDGVAYNFTHKWNTYSINFFKSIPVIILSTHDVENLRTRFSEDRLKYMWLSRSTQPVRQETQSTALALNSTFSNDNVVQMVINSRLFANNKNIYQE